MCFCLRVNPQRIRNIVVSFYIGSINIFIHILYFANKKKKIKPREQKKARGRRLCLLNKRRQVLRPLVLLYGLSRSISRANDVRRAVATHGDPEGCEGERETGCFEQRVLSAWMPNYERSPSQLKFADVLQARKSRSKPANTPA